MKHSEIHRMNTIPFRAWTCTNVPATSPEWAVPIGTVAMESVLPNSAWDPYWFSLLCFRTYLQGLTPSQAGMATMA
jgi:hypothetical protein